VRMDVAGALTGSTDLPKWWVSHMLALRMCSFWQKKKVSGRVCCVRPSTAHL
jgi:hypothetical protein